MSEVYFDFALDPLATHFAVTYKETPNPTYLALPDNGLVKISYQVWIHLGPAGLSFPMCALGSRDMMILMAMPREGGGALSIRRRFMTAFN